MKGLHNLALLRQKVGLRTVLQKMTVSRLPEYAEFVYRNLPFTNHVALMGLEMTGLALQNMEKVWIEPLDYLDELRTTLKHLQRRRIPESIYNVPLCLLPKDLWRFARRSISSWKETYSTICGECSARELCCGLFSTSERHSKFISPVSQDDLYMRVEKEGSTYAISIPVKKGLEQDSDTISAFKAMARFMSREIFDSMPVDLHMCDSHS